VNGGVPPGGAADSSSSTPSIASSNSQQPLVAPGKPTTTPADTAGKNKKVVARGISLVLTAKHRCWISVQVDGKQALEDTMDPELSGKKELSFQARDRVVVVAGNPAGIDVTFNGQSLGQIGPTNARQTITFTPEGIQP
jgi:hypothetical protein